MAFGSLSWIEGANCGLESPVISADGASLHLAEAPAFEPPGPVRVRLVEGCDKQLATCHDRFGNAVNFRGEAHLPGNDLLRSEEHTSELQSLMRISYAVFC